MISCTPFADDDYRDNGSSMFIDYVFYVAFHNSVTSRNWSVAYLRFVLFSGPAV